MLEKTPERKPCVEAKGGDVIVMCVVSDVTYDVIKVKKWPWS